MEHVAVRTAPIRGDGRRGRGREGQLLAVDEGRPAESGCRRCRRVRRGSGGHHHQVGAPEDAEIFDEEGNFLDEEGDADEELEARLLLDVVLGEGPRVLELLAGADEALELLRDAFLVVHLLLDGLHGVGALHLQRDGPPR